ncbi:MAG: efflux RND transporter periplasmic adaptor subunit [Cyclonatronaceae bacterium]
MSIVLKRIVISIATLFLAVVAIIFIFGNTQVEDTTATAPVERDTRLAVNLHLVEAERFVNKIFATGTTIANDMVELRSESSGRINRIYFEEGRPVKKGDLLIKINDSELKAQLRRAEYRKNLAQIRETRTRDLLSRNAVSQEEYDTVQNELNVVLADIELIEAQIEKTEIRAPFDGLMGLRYVSEGSYITPSNMVSTLQGIDPIKIDFSIPERFASQVSNDQRIVFRRQGSDRNYEGRIFAIDPRIDAATRTLSIRAISPNPERRILPGSFAEIDLELEAIENAILVPSEALIPELGSYSVFVYDEGTARSRQVVIGVRTDTDVLIVSGLEPGDRVITTGVMQIRSGMPVRIANGN